MGSVISYLKSIVMSTEGEDRGAGLGESEPTTGAGGGMEEPKEEEKIEEQEMDGGEEKKDEDNGEGEGPTAISGGERTERR